MEEIENLAHWESDYEEIDDVLDASFFTTSEELEDPEDDDFHDGFTIPSNPISEL